MNHETTQGSTIGSLLTNLRDETTLLIRQEVSLAKAEIGERARDLTKDLAALMIGGVIAAAGLVVLLIGVGGLIAHGLLAMGASEPLARWLGPLLSGLLAGLAGWVMISTAKKAMSAKNLRPSKTLESLKQNKNWVENKIQQHSHESPA